MVAAEGWLTAATRTWLPRIAVALTLSVGACQDAFSPPAGSRPLTPPPVYLLAWERVTNCAHLEGNFERIRWFVAPGVVSFACPAEFGQCDGLWHPPHDIYLTALAAADSARGFRVVQHEMLHDLLAGGADHPPIFTSCLLMPGQNPGPFEPASATAASIASEWPGERPR